MKNKTEFAMRNAEREDRADEMVPANIRDAVKTENANPRKRVIRYDVGKPLADAKE